MISNSVTYFGLIRHGKTQWNVDRRIQGKKNDPPLCPQGIEQVEQWRSFLPDTQKWDFILTSHLSRARETARILNKDLKLPLEADERLDEQDWGRWNGKTVQCLKTQHSKQLEVQMSLGWNFRPPEGESRLSVWQRSRKALEDAGKKFAGKNVLVVSHIGVIKTVVYGILKRNFLPDETPLVEPYGLHLLAWENERLVIKNLNLVRLP